MNQQQMNDLAKAVEIISRQLRDGVHGEVIIKTQNGRIVLIEDTVKVKP